MGHPIIYPTGVTIYNKEKAYGGYTVYPSSKGALLIDMNGNEVKLWAGLLGNPNKVLPGGYIMGSTGGRAPQYSRFDNYDLIQADWDGNIVWKFDRYEWVDDPGYEGRYMARQNHDYQREDSPVGYYAPGQEPLTDRGRTLLLVNETITDSAVTKKELTDNTIIEVDWEGNITWKWRPSDHFEELGFSDAAKNVLSRMPLEGLEDGGMGLWLGVNSLSLVGPNKWYDAGDERFHPDNIMWDARNANLVVIVSRETGEIVWKLGPDYTSDERTKKLGWIIGQHHFHMIPKGLPGEGNILIYDNGGPAGYGEPTPSSRYGTSREQRDYSRILEFNPITFDIVWSYSARDAGHLDRLDTNQFHSPFVSSAQRLPNGNTLITEGTNGRLFEVTAEKELVWEYVNPYYYERVTDGKTGIITNLIYRAYRVPYEWIPQLDKPQEREVKPVNITTFRVPGAAGPEEINEVDVAGIDASESVSDPFDKSTYGKGSRVDFCALPSLREEANK